MEPEFLYRVELAYDGTLYDGFQSQISKNAVQDHVEKALATLLRHPVRLQGASRTDKGVHAQNQVGLFKSSLELKESWLAGVNAILFNDINVLSVKHAEPGFHPINSARAKAYRYRLWRGQCYNPFAKRFVWPVPARVKSEDLWNDLKKFEGKQDFAAFRSADSHAKTTVREILECKVDDRGDLIDIWIVGTGFLKQMVRIIVGTVVERAIGKKPILEIEELIARKDRRFCGVTAPAKGLCLVEIFYDQIPPIDKLVARAGNGLTYSI